MSHNPNNKECQGTRCDHLGLHNCTCTPKQDWKKLVGLNIGCGCTLGICNKCAWVHTLLAEARDKQQMEDYEIAKTQQEKAFKSGTEMGERKGYTAGLERAKEVAKQTVYAVEGRISFEEAINKEIDV